MRYTKTLREYVNAELTKKRLEANACDELTIAYNKRRKMAIDEVEEIVEKANKEVIKILEEYGLENLGEARCYSEKEIISYRDVYIGNAKEAKEQREREKIRYEAQKEAEREIEISCTLGANKEEFKKMIASVTF